MAVTLDDWRQLASDDTHGIKRRLLRIDAPNVVANVFTQVIPGHEFWRVLAMQFTLTTSANVGTRQPRPTYSPESGVTFTMSNANGLGASAIGAYNFYPGVSVVTADGLTTTTNFTAPFFDFILEPGQSFGFILGAGQAGDVATNFRALTEVMFTDPDSPPADVVSLGSELVDLEHALELGKMSGLG